MKLSLLLLTVCICALSLASDVPQSGAILANPGLAMETGKWNWTNCGMFLHRRVRVLGDDVSLAGDSSHAIRVKSIKVCPDPPEAGKNVTITAQGDVQEEITVGSPSN